MTYFYSILNESTKLLPNYWPLPHNVAISPLWDLSDKPFHKAIAFFNKFQKISGVKPINHLITGYEKGILSKHNIIDALREYESPYNTNEESEFERFICDSQTYALKTYPHTNKEIATLNQLRDKIINLYLNFYTSSSDLTLDSLLAKHFDLAVIDDFTQLSEHFCQVLSVKPHEIGTLYQYILVQALGWHSFVKWQHHSPEQTWVNKKLRFDEIISLWLSLIKLHFHDKEILALKSYIHHVLNLDKEHSLIPFIWQTAFENSQTEKLKQLCLSSKAKKSSSSPDAQFIFCIDSRSERLRRHIESAGNYQTFSFAGFFNIDFVLQGNDGYQQQAPALLQPKIVLTKKSIKPTFIGSLLNGLSEFYSTIKEHPNTAFLTFELFGLFFMLPNKIIKRISFLFGKNKNKCFKELSIIPFLTDQNIIHTVDRLEAMLKTIGINSKTVAPFIFICGHQAQTDNNAFDATLQCGACGGNSGKWNAQIVASLLNHDTIKQALAKRNLDINETIFAPMLHNTTVNELHLLDNSILSKPLISPIMQDLNNATTKLKQEISSQYPFHSSKPDKHSHWAELNPEWGLLNNQFFIIGSREYTQHINLEGKAFLHSYDAHLDKDGSILSSILNAPLIVAHWINMQYYFASTDGDVFGSGNKTIHSIIPKIGVREGINGDLKIGLPSQSVSYKNKLLHQPVKLNVIIYGFSAICKNVLDNNPQIKKLFDNKWLNLKIVSIDEKNDPSKGVFSD